MSGKGLVGGIFDNDEILWFIILFLLLFFCRPCGPVAGIADC